MQPDMGINSKSKGSAYERWICQWLRDRGYRAETARYVNKKADDLKKDIITNAPFNIQAKATERAGNWHELLKEMHKNFPFEDAVIFHKRNRSGTVVIMDLDTFESMALKDFNHE